MPGILQKYLIDARSNLKDPYILWCSHLDFTEKEPEAQGGDVNFQSHTDGKW